MRQLKLDPADIARMLNTNAGTVSAWLGGQAQLRPDTRERLLELLTVLERLSVVAKPQAAHDWLVAANAMLEHHRPVDLLLDGKYRSVLGAIDALGEGVYV